jgi:SAM-dependent methyltransferase
MTASEPLSVALQDIEQAMPRFAHWLYHTVRGDLGQRVLDAGAGIGTYTELLLDEGKSVIALEYDAAFVTEMKQRFHDDPRVFVHQADLGDLGGLPVFPEADSAICLNVLEHIEDDLQGIRNIRDRVRPGGTLVALVPAYSWLLNPMDRTLGHHRRYARRQFLERLAEGGWVVERCFRFNAFGIPGWFVAGTLLRRNKPGRDLTRLYDFLVPAFAVLERNVIRGAVGLSLVAVCRRDD